MAEGENYAHICPLTSTRVSWHDEELQLGHAAWVMGSLEAAQGVILACLPTPPICHNAVPDSLFHCSSLKQKNKKQNLSSV